jgi:8-amino-7-oxononanoate synthase
MSLSDRWSRILHDLREQGRYRFLQPSDGIDFTSNDYLGYGSGRRGPRGIGGVSPEGQRARNDKSTSSTTHHSPLTTHHLSHSGLASRLLRGQHPIWVEVEQALARWHGCEAALVLTSGYVANVGLLSTVIEPQDWVASDRHNHASIIDGLRLSRAERFLYGHCDLAQLEDGLRQAAIDRTADRQLFVITESLFSMEGDVAPLADLAALAERYEAHLIVDEAHATGCFGVRGAGLVEVAGVRDRVLATVHTGGKALGVTGAYVCGARQLQELLINRCRPFIFTTALPPAIGAWWLQAIPFVQQDEEGRTALHQGVALFRSLLAERGIKPAGNDYIVPVILGTDQQAVQAAQQLQEAGFDIRAIRPPTVPPGTSRLRLSLHADHERDTLTQAATAVAQVVGQMLRSSS